MKVRYSTSKAMLMGAVLLLLSAKGAQELFINDEFSLIVNLPAWLVGLKSMAAPLAALSLAAFCVLAVMAGKKPAKSRLLAIYVAVLAYYFVRSAWLGSNAGDNLLALGIVLACGSAIALDFGANRASGIAAGWMTPLTFFFVAYVMASGMLLFSGFGYAQVGSRFLGLTYHPNSEGALAALGAGFFLAKLRDPARGRKKRALWAMSFCLATLLVLASGSRAAVLMEVLAVLCVASAWHVIAAAILAGLTLSLISVDGSQADATITGAVGRILTATIDNRSGVWGQLLSDFFAHPLIGVGDASQVSGSGFLTAFAGDGLVGGILFVVASALMARRAARAIRDFRQGRPWSAELVAAVLLLQLLLQAVFEGSMFDRFSPFPLLAMILILALPSAKGPSSKVPAQ